MFVGSATEGAASEVLRDVGETPRAARWRLLQAHVERLWEKLPDQSQRRLGVIAASAGVGVNAEEHGRLLGALGLIAEAEGTFEVEREFCETYLCVPWIAEAVAMTERERALRRREQTRLAVSKYREKQRKAEDHKERRRREQREKRLEASLSQKALAIDGEGETTPDGRHLYTYMAASLSDGTVVGELESEEGLPTKAVFDFLAALPKADAEGRTLLGVFGYGLGYDQSKWLEDAKDADIYSLLHDDIEDVNVKVGRRYRLALLGKCLQIDDRKAPAGSKRTAVWDILKGFQSTFVKALRDWEVGTPEEWERIEAMKKLRGSFANEPRERVHGYCQDEVRLLAALVEKYVRAHVEAGIDLRGKYHGAGSTSDAFLTMMGAKEKRCTRKVEDADLEAFGQTQSAFSRAFFGGRAEVSRIGIVRGPIYQADVASAYPHALFDLPCVKHGKWKRVEGKGVGRAVAAARLSCVHFRMELHRSWFRSAAGSSPYETAPVLGKVTAELAREGGRKPRSEAMTKKELDELTQLEFGVNRRASMNRIEGAGTSELAWGPLPYRTEHGRILFPAAHPGGWAWAPEYQVAKRFFPDQVVASEAWVLSSSCQCEPPYRAIGEYYLLRIEWGSASKGKALKLGMNGCYGKYAQVVGKNPKYACRVVAGQITATTRGRLVEAILSAKNPWAYVYAATDGLLATEPISPPDPPRNETWDGVEDYNRRTGKKKSGLGAWEVERHEGDIFIVQPGFYFGLKPKSKARTRGTPLEVIDAFRPSIIEQWKKKPTAKPKGLPQQDFFCGAKIGVRKPTKKVPHYTRDPMYGRWTKMDRKINYVVSPKRSDLEDLGDGSYRLFGWWLSPSQPESSLYKKDPVFVEEQDRDDDQPDFVEPLLQGVGRDGEGL